MPNQNTDKPKKAALMKFSKENIDTLKQLIEKNNNPNFSDLKRRILNAINNNESLCEMNFSPDEQTLLRRLARNNGELTEKLNVELGTRKFSPNYEANEFIELIEDTEADLPNIDEINAELFVGLSRHGKGTTINYLRNLDMIQVPIPGGSKAYDVSSKNKEHATGTSHQSSSHTITPSTYSLTKDNPPLTAVDTGGVDETRGDNVALCIADAMKSLASRTKSLKGITVVMKYSAIGNGAAIGEARKLFDYLSQLTDELDPHKFAFCITDLKATSLDIKEDLSSDDHTPSDDEIDAEIRRRVIESVKEKLIASKQSEIDLEANSPDVTKAKKYIKAAELVTKDNIFLMRNLEKKERQQEVLASYFAYTTEPSRKLEKPLKAVVTNETSANVKLEAIRVSSNGLNTLKSLAETKAKAHELQKKISDLKELHSNLENAQLELTHATEKLEELHNNHDKKTAELESLKKQGDNWFEFEHAATDEDGNELKIPYSPYAPKAIFEAEITVPKKAALKSSDNVTLVKRTITDFGYDPSIHNEDHVVFRVTFDTSTPLKSAGSNVRDNGDGTITLIVPVTYTLKNHPTYGKEYSENLKELSERVNNFDQLSDELERTKEEKIAQIYDLKSQILTTAPELKLSDLNIRESDETLTILANLQTKIYQLNKQVSELAPQITSFKTEVEKNTVDFEGIRRLSQLIDLTNESNVREFLSEYDAYLKTKNEPDIKVEVLPITQPTAANTSSFFGNSNATATRTRSVDPNAGMSNTGAQLQQQQQRQQQRQQQHGNLSRTYTNGVDSIFSTNQQPAASKNNDQYSNNPNKPSALASYS